MFFKNKRDPNYEGPDKVFLLESKIFTTDKYFPILRKALIGGPPLSDIDLSNFGINDNVGIIRANLDLLSITPIGNQYPIFVNKDECQIGKMYLLKNGDSIKISNLTFVVKEKDLYSQKDYNQYFPQNFSSPIQEEEDTEIEEEEFEEEVLEIEEPLIGPGPRTFAFLSNIIFSAILLYGILPLLDSERTLQVFINNLINTIPADVSENFIQAITREVYQFSLQVLLMTFFFNFLSHLILGQSFSLFILSGKYREISLKNNIKGVVRFFISLILSPLIIFDLPLFLDKKTLKEVLSGSSIEYKSDSFAPKGNFLLLIILIITYFLPSLFISMDHLKELPFQSFIPKRTTPIKNPLTINSSFLSVNGSIESDDQLILLPTKNNGQLGILSINPQSEGLMVLNKVGNLNFSNLLESYRLGNPLFSIFYPHLSGFISDDPSYTKFNSFQEEELSDLLSHTMPVSPLNIFAFFDLLKTQGPLYFSPLTFRKNFLEKTLNPQSAQALLLPNISLLILFKEIDNDNEGYLTFIGPYNSPLFSFQILKGKNETPLTIFRKFFAELKLSENPNNILAGAPNSSNQATVMLLDELSKKRPINPQLSQIVQGTLQKLLAGTNKKWNKYLKNTQALFKNQ